MAIDQEVLGILVRLEGKTAFIASVREEQGAIKGYTTSLREASAAGDAASASQAKIASGGALVSKTMKAGGLAIVAAMVEGAKTSMNFNRQLEMVATQAGASQKEVGYLRREILALHGLPQTPQELAQAVYHLESVGLRGAHAFDAMKIAAQGAAVGQANVEDTASALGAAWVANIKGGGDFYKVMSVLNATVGAGNMRMEELVQALGTGILPAAKLAGLSIQQVGAALAVLTDQGYKPSSAAAQLATALHFLYSPSAKANAALESMGLTQGVLVEKLSGPNGALEALKLLHDRLAQVGGHAEQLKVLGEILPGGRGRVLLTLLEQLDRLEMKQRQIAGTSGEFGKDVERTMREPAVRIKIAWSEFLKTLIKLGEELEGPGATGLGVVLGVAGALLKVLMLLSLEGKLLVPIILLGAGAWLIYKGYLIGAAVAAWAYDAAQTVLLVGMYAMDAALGAAELAWIALSIAMDANPIGLIVLGVAAAIAIIVLLATHFHAVINFLRGPWGTIAILLTGPFAPLLLIALHFGKVKSAAVSVYNWVKSNWGKIGHVLAAPFELLWAKAKWVIDHIKALLGGSAGHGGGGFSLGSLAGKAAEVLIPGLGPAKGLAHMLGLAGGGSVPYNGYYNINENSVGERVWLPKGSRVESSPADSLSQPRHHTPNPAADTGWRDGLPQLEATLVLPNGETLADLVVVNLKKKKQRL